MVAGTIVMLIMTLGLSRLLLHFIPGSIEGKRRIVISNLGSVLLITSIYVAIWASESDTGVGLIVLGAAFAVFCQVVWYWRDISNLDSTPLVTTRQSHPFTQREKAAPIKPVEQPMTELTNFPAEKWQALVKFDDDIASASEKLRPYGGQWIIELGRAYFALDENKQYLPSIVRRLTDDAEREKSQTRATFFQRTAEGEAFTESALNILKRAERSGYTLSVQKNKSIKVIRPGLGTTVLWSNSDIERFGTFAKFDKA